MTIVMRDGVGPSPIEISPGAVDHHFMLLTSPDIDADQAVSDTGHLTLVRSLMLVQIGIIVTATVEALILGLVSFALAFLPILNAVFALWTMMLMRGIGRLSARARTWTLRLQVGWIALAAVDMAFAMLMADRSLEPVPVITRILLPAVLIYLLRRPDVRSRFS